MNRMNAEYASELRIIARDGASLSSADKIVLERAATELDNLLRLCVLLSSELAESQQHRLALQEAVAEYRRKEQSQQKPSMSLSTGWMTVVPRAPYQP